MNVTRQTFLFPVKRENFWLDLFHNNQTQRLIYTTNWITQKRTLFEILDEDNKTSR